MFSGAWAVESRDGGPRWLFAVALAVAPEATESVIRLLLGRTSVAFGERGSQLSG